MRPTTTAERSTSTKPVKAAMLSFFGWWKNLLRLETHAAAGGKGKGKDGKGKDGKGYVLDTVLNTPARCPPCARGLQVRARTARERAKTKEKGKAGRSIAVARAVALIETLEKVCDQHPEARRVK